MTKNKWISNKVNLHLTWESKNIFTENFGIFFLFLTFFGYIDDFVPIFFLKVIKNSLETTQDDIFELKKIYKTANFQI